MIPRSEIKKMNEELRKFCRGNPIIPDGYDFIRVYRKTSTPTRPKKKKKGQSETMGGISKLISKIFK